MISPLSLVFAPLLLLAGVVAQSPTGPTRLSPPERPAVESALALIRSGFAEEYEVLGSDAAARTFCRRLVLLAEETGDDLAAQFALYEEAARIAREHREFAVAFTALDGLASVFEVDGLQLQWELLRALDRDGLAVDQQANTVEAQFVCELLDEAIATERFAMAQEFADRLSTLLPHLEVAARALAAERVAALAAARSQHVEIAQVLEQVAAGKPVSVEERQRAGEYWCFVKEDWQRGLPLLANNGGSAVAKAARSALSARSEATTLAEADGWWSFAEASSGQARRSMLRRAIRLYRSVLPGLRGLDQLRVEQRLKDSGPFVDALATAARRYFEVGWTRLGERVLDDLATLDPDLAAAIKAEQGSEKR